MSTTSSLAPWSWKSRFYALLLRRVLGPFLSPKSASDLHQSIKDVDWTDGRFVLVDVELDSEYLTGLISKKGGGSGGSGGDDDVESHNPSHRTNANIDGNSANRLNVSICHARIKKISIQFSVIELENIGKGEDETRSMARKATIAILRGVFGSGQSSNSDENDESNPGGVAGDSNGVGLALVAHVELSGLKVALAPERNRGETDMHRQSPQYRNQSRSVDTVNTSIFFSTSLEQNSMEKSSHTPAPSTPGFFSSMIDSALKSLRLSVKINDVNIRAYSQFGRYTGIPTFNDFGATPECSNNVSNDFFQGSNSGCSWVGIHLSSACYYDLMQPQRVSDRVNTSNIKAKCKRDETMAVAKAVDWDGLIVETGQCSLGAEVGVDDVDSIGNIDLVKAFSSSSLCVLKTEGVGSVRFGVFEKRSIPSHSKSGDVVTKTLSARQSIELSFGYSIAVEAGLTSMEHAVEVSSALTSVIPFDQPSENDDNELNTPSPTSTLSTNPIPVENGKHRESYDEIMKQYTEARHFARTRELRGGILLPSFDGDGHGSGSVSGDGDGYSREVSFDAFFDANEHSVSYYCSMMEENSGSGEGEGGNNYVEAPSQGIHSSLSQTDIDILVNKFTIKLNLPEDNNEVDSSFCNSSEFMLITVDDLRLIYFGSKGESTINFSLHYFDVEAQLIGYPDTNSCQQPFVNESLLHFVSESAKNGLLVKTPPCISMLAEFNDGVDQNRRIDIILQPLEIIHQQRLVLGLSKISEKLSRGSVATRPKEAQSKDPAILHLSISCSSIVIIVPCNRYMQQTPKRKNINPLFRQFSYREEEARARPFLGLGLEFENVTTEYSKKVAMVDVSPGSNLEESRATMKCSNIIAFAKITESECHGRRSRKFASYVTRRTDLMTFTGDDGREADAHVMVSFSRFLGHQSESSKSRPQLSMKGRSSFPIVLPLSSMKTRQESDDDTDDMDDLYDDVMNSLNNTGLGASPRMTSDPQYILSSEANEAERELVVNIPNILFCTTTSERQELVKIFSTFSSEMQSFEKTEDCKQNDSINSQNDNSAISLLVNVGQISVGLCDGTGNLEHNLSYSIVLDKLQVHVLVISSGVRNVRVMCHDATLYEMFYSVYSSSIKARSRQRPKACTDKMKLIQERFTRNAPVTSRAIIFRSKLCQPLSPETPAILVDLLLRKESNPMSSNDPSNECDELTIHANIYDMTYRYVMDSKWIQNITCLIKGEAIGSNNGSKTSKTSRNNRFEQATSEPLPLLINLFLNINDCNFDYTSPPNFCTGSRVILRMGEVRLTSNIMTPSTKIQGYKLSLSDLSVHICNYRYPCNEENSRLSRAHRYLQKEDLLVPKKVKRHNVVTVDDILCRMDFIKLAGLDTLDALILNSNSVQIQQGKAAQVDPSLTVALTIGVLSLHACQDSFACLNSTYNEWFLKFTTLTEEEMQSLRALSESQSNVGVEAGLEYPENECLSPLTQQEKEGVDYQTKPDLLLSKKSAKCPATGFKENNASTSKHLYRDDDVSLDLTKSLLFQNYYTFDAHKSSHQQNNDWQQSSPFVQRKKGGGKMKPCGSDHEWTAVEHDFFRHSNIPMDRDQMARWTFVDATSNNESKKSSGTGEQSQPVKVFPQHIPAKPVSDPLAGNNISATKLVGIQKSSHIEMRVIIKNASIQCRFYDGLDWKANISKCKCLQIKPLDRKKELLHNLTVNDNNLSLGSAIKGVPLPEERNEHLKQASKERKLFRNVNRYFQISIGGLKLKNDSFEESKEHQLTSCLDLSVADFFIAETISQGTPIKMLGEWVNENEHPRDDSDGVIMLKMITKHPNLRVSADGKLMSDESRATLELLPIRCYVHQTTVRFIRGFFGGHLMEPDSPRVLEKEENGISSEDEIINVFFQTFKCLPCKLKVDYTPEKMDVDSFREGNYVEILNLCPLEEMVLTLQAVENQDLTGWGSVISELASRWIEDICATQAHKFFTRAAPVQFFSNVGEGVADLVIIPLELLSSDAERTDYFKSVRDGTTSFAGKVACEALSTSAKLTRFAANQLNTKALPSAGLTSSLPERPRSVPRHASDAAGHAYESILGGLREANYKIVTVPYREYQQHGACGAARSAVRGIPIAVLAPLSGASEALSYTLLGLRNQLRPDLRKEEEATLRGLN